MARFMACPFERSVEAPDISTLWQGFGCNATHIEVVGPRRAIAFAGKRGGHGRLAALQFQAGLLDHTRRGCLGNPARVGGCGAAPWREVWRMLQMQKGRRPPRSRVAWFAGLWTAGILTVLAIAALLRH